jgi:hypothetical protein
MAEKNDQNAFLKLKKNNIMRNQQIHKAFDSETITIYVPCYGSDVVYFTVTEHEKIGYFTNG